jgi:hypothetical protein
MAAIEPLCHLVGIDSKKLSKEEYILLEAEIFIRICDELKNSFKEKHKDYFRVMKFTIEKENSMLENNFVRLIANDILSTEEYNLNGIANYADTPEDVVQEVIDGRNIRPSANLLWRLISLHRSVRAELYDTIVKKIASQYLSHPQKEVS